MFARTRLSAPFALIAALAAFSAYSEKSNCYAISIYGTAGQAAKLRPLPLRTMAEKYTKGEESRAVIA